MAERRAVEGSHGRRRDYRVCIWRNAREEREHEKNSVTTFRHLPVRCEVCAR
jgi:hypothetical protein